MIPRNTITLNRRSFAAGAAAVSFVGLPTFRNLSAQETSSPAAASATESGTPTLGSSRADWDAAAGPAEEAGEFSRYLSPVDGVTPVIVGFTDDVATFIEYRFTDAPLAPEDAEQFYAASVPAEGMIGDRFLFMEFTEETGPYSVQLVALPSEVPSSGAIIVTALEDANEGSAVKAISITSSNEPDVQLPISGDPGGLGIGREQWIGSYGEPPETRYDEEAYPGVGPEQMDVIIKYLPQEDVIAGIHANADQLETLAATRESALEFVGKSIPADGEVLQHFYLPATEGGPLALRFFSLQSAEASEALHTKGVIGAMLHERADDPEPRVTRIDMGRTQM